MSAEEILEENENTALTNSQFIANVSGIKQKSKKLSGGKLKAIGAMGFLTAMIVVFALLFSSGNLIPSAISERLIEETDVQYADAVESKKLVFQQALQNGDLPNNTVNILRSKGVLVGYMNGDEFVETNQNEGGLVLKMGDKIIPAGNFISEVNDSVELYNAFNEATYSRAAYYYDDAAKKVFKKIGTTRNNYTSETEFDDVMDSLIGKGSNINVNSVSIVEKVKTNQETGEQTVYYDYETNGGNAKSNAESSEFINEVRSKNRGASKEESALGAADSLKVADKISKAQRSSLFFITFMENISKMKAGEGDESQINEAMNYLYKSEESEVVDTKTSEIIKTTGTPLESPSLYAVLADSKVNVEDVRNYSTERVLDTIENAVGSHDSGEIIAGTVASASEKVRGVVGRYTSGSEVASEEALNRVAPTIQSSLVDNSYETIKGIDAGEFLVEGAINVGKELAKASGGTPGDENAVREYARLNNTVLAMDAKADRLERSPFDITSKNTFLGSIIYNLAVAMSHNTSGIFSGVNTFTETVSTSVVALLPTSYADDEKGYLTTFGDCKTQATIGAVGSAQCAETATFDTSTLNDTFNDPGFKSFVEANTTLSSSGTRTINKDGVLAEFIKYNDERVTPVGVVDGGILESETNNSKSVSFVSNILGMIKRFLGSDDSSKRKASGAAFVNSSSNSDWDTYKYAQRYVSLARATESLRQYADDKTAYSSIKFFEGEENPVIAFLNDYYAYLGE